MRTGFLLVSIALLTNTFAVADTWEQTYGTDLPEQSLFSLVTEDGGILTCGMFIIDVSYSIVSSEGPGGLDCMLVRTDANNEILWEGDYFSGPWPDLAVAGVETEDGCFVLAGVTTTMEEGQQNWIFKVDDEGEIVWDKTLGTDYDDWTYDMIETADGGFVLAGYVDSLNGNGSVISLLKADNQGNELWNRQFPAAGTGMAEAVMEIDNGDFLVTGYVVAGESDNAIPFLLRTDDAGNEIWMEIIDVQPGYYYPIDMTMVNNGNIIIAGYCESIKGGYDFWIGEVTIDGDLISQSTFGGEMDDMAFSVTSCSRGFVVAGSTASEGAGGNDIWLLCIDDSGEEVWSVTHGGVGNEGAEDIIKSPGGGFIVSGYTASWGAGNTDIWVLKVGEEGQMEE
ncbi:MAG: hypothetical protein K8S24_07420 [Candidatus Aegiribacteria sp.]|nr:hypothetical protein [Candidatus Aegiribacteria sp.]